MESFEHDEARRVISLVTGAHRAMLIYAPAGDGVVEFQSTYVPDALRGRRIGTRLVCHALDWARAKGLKVIPSCWFVGVVVREHPEFGDLIDG